MKTTIFASSAVPLKKWFYGVFLMSQSKEGVPAKELERKLGVVYPTAWRMAKLIRSVRPHEKEWGKPTYFDSYLQSCILTEAPNNALKKKEAILRERK